MNDLYQYLAMGFVFGLSAGISPGPLLTLVVTETLRHGVKEGIKVAIAPLITDIPIILITTFVLSKFTSINFFLALMSIAGGLFIGYLAWESLKTKSVVINIAKAKPQSLQRGIITNALSPHPYLFYFVVGGPIILKAAAINILTPIAFVIAFTATLVGSKIVVALIVEKSRSFLKSTKYIYTMRILGAILLMFAVVFFKEGIHYLGL